MGADVARGVNGYEDSKVLRNANRRRTSLRTRSVRHSNRRLVQEWLDIIEARGRAQDDAEANLTNAVQVRQMTRRLHHHRVSVRSEGMRRVLWVPAGYWSANPGVH